jgi:hypothetical protein
MSEEPVDQPPGRVERRPLDHAHRAGVRRRMELIQAGNGEWIDEDEVLSELEADP